MLGTASLPCPLRVAQVKGFEGRTNDIIYCHPLDKAPHSSAVVFFGGDVQVEFLNDTKFFVLCSSMQGC